MIGTRRIYGEWTAESDPAYQKYIGLILRLSCEAAIFCRSRDNDQNVVNLGQICENLSRWGLAALTLPLQKHTGVCRYVNEERSAGKSQKKIEM